MSVIQKTYNIRLRPSEAMKFYKFQLNQVTLADGRKDRSEITKLFHATMRQLPNGMTDVLLETFERTHRDRRLATSEKEFLSQIATITDEIRLKVDNTGNYVEFTNLGEIHKKAEQKIKKLSKSYVGENAEKQFRFLKSFYKNGKTIIRDLYRYKQFGLLFNPFYGQYEPSEIKEATLRYTNFIDNILNQVTEYALPIQVNEAENEIEIHVKGKLQDDVSIETYRMILDNRQIPYTEKDLPSLDKYEGSFVFALDTGVVKQAGLNIVFSFGENYHKTINYTLKEISHEEV